MSFLTPQAELDYKDSLRKREVSYYVGNPEKNLRGHLYDFCVDILGYDALSETFHKPMLDEWDRMDLKRWRIYYGFEPRGTDPIDNLDLWFRGAIKTWCTRARVARYYLVHPGTTVTWFHAVEESALESGQAIADYLQLNKKLRALFPVGVLPAMNRKKFFSGGSFNLTGKRVGDSWSLKCLGAGGEGTGKHSLVVVLDDFVGHNDVVDGQMPKKKQFFQATPCNIVLRLDGKYGWMDAIGTHWSIDDPYTEWRKSQDWVHRVRACLETDGKPDPNGEPVYLSRDQIEKEKRRQPGLFSYQMMNDPTPSGEMPWNPSCERTCALEEAKGHGHILVLSDPAPFAVGSVDGRDEVYRKDGTKNFWATVVVKLRRRGELYEIILLDAIQSRSWGLEEGMQAAIRLALKWHAREGYAETTSTPVYLESFMRAKRDLGWKGSIIGSHKHIDPNDRLKSTYNSRAKCNYITALADKAKEGEVTVCDSFPLREEFWGQMRLFRPQPDGRTGIPFDDLVNAVAFATDPYFSKRYPVVAEEEAGWSPYREPENDEASQGGRYVRW